MPVHGCMLCACSCGSAAVLQPAGHASCPASAPYQAAVQLSCQQPAMQAVLQVHLPRQKCSGPQMHCHLLGRTLVAGSTILAAASYAPVLQVFTEQAILQEPAMQSCKCTCPCCCAASCKCLATCWADICCRQLCPAHSSCRQFRCLATCWACLQPAAQHCICQALLSCKGLGFGQWSETASFPQSNCKLSGCIIHCSVLKRCLLEQRIQLNPVIHTGDTARYIYTTLATPALS